MNFRSKILIVDDNPTNVAILEEILEEYELKSVMSGEEALEVVSKFQPDLILLDIMMPGINGYQVCEAIRKDASTKQSKIIMVSAKAMVSERIKGYEMGADDYITKPFEEVELLAKVRVYLRLKRVEEVDQLKTDFLRLLCLDTVSPLSSITGPLKAALNNKELSIEEREEKLNLSYGNALNLQVLFEKVNLLNSIKSGNYKFDKQDQDLCKIIREAIISIQDKAIEREITIREVLPVFAFALLDRKQFLRSIISILDNAVRFSDSGGRVIVELSEAEENFFLTVIDQGKGMDPTSVNELFNEFTYMELDKANALWRGLSLVLAKQIVEAHQGTLTIESVKSSGTIVTIGLSKQSNSSNFDGRNVDTAIMMESSAMV